MPPVPSRFATFARLVLLPTALSLGTVLGLGSHYEASDDASLTWLFSGVLAPKPVPSVPLYFHGYGHLLAALYTAVPGVPWTGLLLGALLASATALTFAVLDRLLRPYLRPGWRALALVVFFGGAWLEHWQWFSYVRVALLLAGGAVLFAAQRPGRWGPLLLGLAGLAAAWLLRPSLAVLALGAVAPAAPALAGGWRRAAPLLGCVALGLALATAVLAGRQTPAEARAQARDSFFARVLDFEQLCPQPRTPADSLGTAAVGLWLLGDSAAMSQGLARRAYRFDAAAFWGHTAPAKLGLRAALLARDYFPVLLALAATAAARARRRGAGRPGFWLVQFGFAGALAMLAGVFKLPPRLALPLLDFWLLNNLVFLLQPAAERPFQDPAASLPEESDAAPTPLSLGRFGRWGAALALATGLLYGAKILHRRQVLGVEQSRHERAWAEISRRTAGRVLAGTNDLLKSLSPFRVYRAGAGPVLLLSGWPAHDPSQPALRQALTGAADQTECLRRLAAPGQSTQWLLSAETAHWLNRRFRHAGAGLVLRPGPALAADTTLRFYQPQWR